MPYVQLFSYSVVQWFSGSRRVRFAALRDFFLWFFLQALTDKFIMRRTASVERAVVVNCGGAGLLARQENCRAKKWF